MSDFSTLLVVAIVATGIGVLGGWMLAAKRGRSELQKQTAIQNAELLGLQKQMDAVTFSISHDLRAPLRAIDGFSRELFDNAPHLSDDHKRYLTLVRQAAQKMSHLIEDLLKLSRVSRASLTVEAVDVSALAQEILNEMRALEPDRVVQTDVVGAWVVKADSKLLRVALEHLLNNAWKFTRKSTSPSIQIGQQVVDHQPALYIKDNGIGFNMTYASKLFDPFQKLHTQPDFPGNGIGLSIAHRIIERHRGKLWGQGVENKGATFYVSLPN